MSRSPNSKKQARPGPQPIALAKSPNGNALRFLGVLALLLVLSAVGSWAFMEYVVWNKLPSELVGKWVVTGGEQDGATFDFYRSGRMRAIINAGGKEGIIHAYVAVDGDALVITTQNPHTRMEEIKTHTIKVLNDRQLVLQDERKTIFRMERARD